MLKSLDQENKDLQYLSFCCSPNTDVQKSPVASTAHRSESLLSHGVNHRREKELLARKPDSAHRNRCPHPRTCMLHAGTITRLGCTRLRSMMATYVLSNNVVLNNSQASDVFPRRTWDKRSNPRCVHIGRRQICTVRKISCFEFLLLMQSRFA